MTDLATSGKVFLVALQAYLLGSIPFGYLAYRWRHGEDIRATGSGNIGATNVLRAAGLASGAATLVLDAAKGYLGVVLAAAIVSNSPEWTSLAAIFAILGHIFPVFLKFRGGKGVATGLGVFLVLAPSAALVALAVFVVVVLVWRYVSLASILAAATIPLAIVVVGSASPPLLAAAILGAGMIIARHSSNLQRLWAGTERRIRWKERTG